MEQKYSSSISEKNTNIQIFNDNLNNSKENETLSFQDKELEKLKQNNYNKETNKTSENNKFQKIKNNENESLNITIKNNINIRNIGNNFVLNGKYIFGPLYTLWVLISMMILSGIYWIYWIYFLGDFYSKYIYIIMSLFLGLSEYYFFLIYITEPGIIPRNHPDFTSEEKEVKDEKDDKNKQEIQRIYTERKCKTCNIIRPKKCSHCFICDNCVLEFDHHCAFVSNCIGKRNHKYFLLFLLYGSLFMLPLIILNTIVIINVYIINYNEILYHIIKGNKYILYLIVFCFISSIHFCFRPRGQNIASFLVIFGLCLFFYLWYKYVPRNDDKPRYFSPIINIFFILCLTFGFFLIGAFCNQIYVVSRKSTIKQDASIKAKIKELHQENANIKISEDYNRNITFKEKMNNVIDCLFAKIDRSLIVPDRDL
jgi:hypothetical protein